MIFPLVAGNSLTRSKAIIHFATLAIESGVLSIRSSRWNSSSRGTPTCEHAARNFVTFDVLTNPSSRWSTRGMCPGSNLFTSLFLNFSSFEFEIAIALFNEGGG